MVKVFSGANLLQELPLSEMPTAIAVYRAGDDSKVPLLAVAAGDRISAFKSFKPYLQYRLPMRDPQAAEQEAWAQAARAEARCNVGA